MSRGLTVSSIKVPTSAGPMFSGGSYIGATDKPGSGSRPLSHHMANITAKAQKGRVRMGLLRTNQMALVSEPGSFSKSLGMYTSRVSPPRGGSSEVSKLAEGPSTDAAAGSAEP